MHYDFDVIIMGAGITGLSLANLLKAQGYKILIVDKRDYNEVLTATSADMQRYSALSWPNINLLKKICPGALSLSGKIYSMQLAYGQWQHHISIMAAMAQQPYLSLMINNHNIIKQLAINLHNCHWCDAQPDALIIDPQYAQLTLKQLTDKLTYTARFVIGADGKDSWLRMQAGFKAHYFNYDHTAIIATITSQSRHHQIAKQNFSKNGPVALLPLHEPHTYTLVWSMSHNIAQDLMSGSSDNFVEQLSAQFNYSLGRLQLVSKLYAIPLQGHHVTNYIQDSAILIGDAAHAVHPLAGQGLNLGLLDAAKLAEAMGSYNLYDYKINKLLHKHYQIPRYSHNQAMLYIINRLYKLQYSNVVPFISAMQIGLQAFRFGVLQKKLIQIANGYPHALSAFNEI